MDEEGVLCERCNACLQGTAEPFDPWGVYNPYKVKRCHHSCLEDFTSALAKHCPFCVGLWNHQRDRSGSCEIDPDYRRDTRWQAVDGESPPYIRVSVVSRKIVTFSTNLYPRRVEHTFILEPLATREGKTAQAIISEGSLDGEGSTSTGSTQSLNTLQFWIEDCQRYHAPCAAPEEWRPTRLLHILSSDRVRLVDTRSCTSSRYCTLSHCWGAPDKAKSLLKKKTVHNLMQGMDVATLPRTFKDAIGVCVHLRVDYMWIDTLCIIQDDHEDWARESRMMHKIYMRGYCNLSATASHDGDGGLFRSRDSSHLARTILTVQEPRSDHIQVLKPGRYSYIDSCYIREYLNNTPLQSRAWVFQERMLSPRNIHFAKHELIWECNTRTAFERLPTGFAKMNYMVLGKLKDVQRGIEKLKDLSGSSPENNNLKMGELLRIWSRIQEDYSQRRLTYSKDRIIALLGVTCMLEAIFGCRCHFGLWENHLKAGLLWRTARNDRDELSDHGTAIPSFSWLSTADQTIPIVPEYRDFDRFPRFDVVDYRLVDDGAVSDFHPHINLSGQLKAATLSLADRGQGTVFTSLHGVKLLDPARFDRVSDLRPALSRSSNSHFCLFISWVPVVPGLRLPGHWYIILQLEGGDDRPCRHFYRRLGVGRIDATEEEVLDARSGQEESFPCESYDSKTGKHVIRLE